MYKRGFIELNMIKCILIFQTEILNPDSQIDSFCISLFIIP